MDNWIHRADNMGCATCMYFVEKVTAPTDEEEANSCIGRCKRHAPTLGGWPAVFRTDWCGDHKIDENKI